MYVEGVMNYTGSKFKILNQILPELDYTKKYFIDLFAGSGVVAINVVDRYDRILVNDIIPEIIGIHRGLLESDKIMIEAAVSVNTTTTTSEKNQYSYDATKRDYSIFDEEYSNNFENEFFRESIELNYRFTEKTYNVMLGLSGQPSQTKNIRTYGNGLVTDTTYGVFNFRISS
jgi:site-specific DNA-adenine methylase